MQNGDPFTYFQNRPLHVAEGARSTSGDLAGVVLHRATPLMPTFDLARCFSGRARIVRHRAITGFSGVRRLPSARGRPAGSPLEVDGDFIGTVPEAVFGLEPGALTVVA